MLLAASDLAAYHFLLSLLAIALAVYGIVLLVRGSILAGIGCIIAAILVGPGGISIFS